MIPALPSLPPSLTPSLPPFFPSSIPPSLSPSLTPSLSLPLPLSLSLPIYLLSSLPPSFPPSLPPQGIELFSHSGDNLFLALPSHSERNALYDRILFQPSTRLELLSLEEATHQWQAGDMSNYDYLMLLNL